MIDVVVCLIIALLVAAALLGVVNAVLSLPPFSGFAPYSRVIYALIVLLIVLLVIQYCLVGGSRITHFG
jgi:hypothetical protein